MRTRYLFLLAGVFFASAAFGATETRWKGVGLGNYLTPENWSLGTVPGADSSVVIGVDGDAVLSGVSTSTYLTLGGNGALTVGPGGSLTLTDSFWIGNKDGGESVLTIDGGTVVFGHFNAGNGGPSRIVLKDGALQCGNFAGVTGQCMLGYAWNGASTLEIRGGTFDAPGTKDGDSFYLGRNADGTVQQTGGRYLCGNYLALGLYSGFKGIYNLYGGDVSFLHGGMAYGCSIGSQGYGEFNIYGGTVTAANGRFQLSDASTAFGKLRLCGGRLQIHPFTKDNGATTRDNMFILWNGGTFALPPGTAEYAASDYFANVQNMYMGPDGLTLDTAGNTFTVDAPIADLGGPGRLEKVGAGTLVLGTRDGFAGGVQVTEGTVRLGSEPAPSPRGPATNTLPVTARTRVNARDYLLHRWSFNGDYLDSVGGQTAQPSATGVHLEDGAAVLEQGTSNSQNRFVALGSNVIPADGSPSTIEMWVREDARANWSMLFSLSSQTKSSAPDGAFYMTFDHAGSGTDNVTCLGTAAAELLATASNLGTYTLGEYYLVAVSFEPLTDGSTRIRWRRFDTHTGIVLGCGETVLQDWMPARLDPEAFNLGWCCVSGINSAYARYDEVRVWNAVLEDDMLAMDARLGPDALPLIVNEAAPRTLSVAAEDGDYLLHRWSFNGDYADSVGGQTAQPSATGVHLEDGAVVLEYGTDNRYDRCVSLGPNAIPADGSPSTIEMWVREDARASWAMLFTIAQGRSSTPAGAFYMTFDQLNANGTNNITCIGLDGAMRLETSSDMGSYTLGEYYLVAVSFEPLTDGSTRIRWRRLDAYSGTILGGGETILQDWTPAQLHRETFNLGWCCVPNVWSAYARYDEVRVWNAVLNDDQLVMDARLGPDVLPQITRDPAAFSLSPLSVAAGAVFDLGAAGVALADFSGAGTVDGTGTLAVTNSFTPEAGLALNAPVVVSGEWVVNIGEDGTCPVVTGTGSLSLDNVTVRVVGADRLDDSVRDLLLARMPAGGATGSAKLVTGFASRRYILRTSADGSLHLSRPGMTVMFR